MGLQGLLCCHWQFATQHHHWWATSVCKSRSWVAINQHRQVVMLLCVPDLFVRLAVVDSLRMRLSA